jgi:pSer/pThr/pTyr-binding forkhead associated (FHA) protein
MTLQARTVLNLIAGAIGGAVAWVVIDLTGWFVSVTIAGAVIAPGSARFWLLIILGGILGACVSILLGLVDALSIDSNQQRIRGLALHGLIGLGGGMVGMYFGQGIWAVLGPHVFNIDNLNPAQFIQELVAKAIGWGLIGAGVGVSQGIARQSLPLIRQGLFGGLAGGLVGGVLFQSAASVIGSGSPARLLGFVCMGASIGFFIGLIQTLFRQAWIRVVLGRNEGKEYLIAKPVTVIGRSELADIGLFGNPKIMKEHCAIEQVQGRFRLQVITPAASPQGGQAPANVKVNGMVVNPDVWLTNGDTITLDDRNLVFHERLSRKSAQTPGPQNPAPAAPPPAVKQAAVVKIIEGAEIGRSFPIGPSPALIGRTDDCTICLSKDTLVSRKHAVIQVNGSEWSLTDSGSVNGTSVNNNKLDQSATIKLRSGDHIRVGDTVLRIEF